MSTNKSKAVKELEKMRKGPLKFRNLLLSLRTTEEISQVDLAKKVKTTKTRICNFEKGRRLPSLELAAKRAKALGHSEALFVSKIIEEQIRGAKLDLKVKIEVA